MNKENIITLLLVLTAMAAQGQTKDSIYVNGPVADAFTKAAVPDVSVTLMRQDSTIVDTTHVYKGNSYTWGIGRSASRRSISSSSNTPTTRRPSPT